MERTAAPEGMEAVFERPTSLVATPTHYCPGCGHGVIHRALARAIDGLGIQSTTVGVAPVGCSVFMYEYLDVDWQQAAHGRASAVAAGVKRVLPDRMVFSYQGDGDLAAIGTSETIHVANRGENILMIFVNNAIYGMTGGQMAPTTPLGMKTTTTPYGREPATMGYPLRITDLVAALPGACYVTRQAVHTVAAVRRLEKAIEQSFRLQAQGRGTCFVEIVSACPSGWKLTPQEANARVEAQMLKEYPLGDLKVPTP
ncbi:MAG TPA: thiamine pyrophosphate-dependent enzyme [Anaeromyxobacteraceae bacterium]|nr:thiamine pyrophosphate-dependent enzyme [Anaeromyxobacteraceae bacterium]